MERTDNYKKHTNKNPLQRFLIDNFYTTLISFVKPLHSEKVLDVGCGEGFTLARISKENIGKQLEGIDYSKTAIELGKKVHPKLALKTADVYNLPYKENVFDLVISTEVLEHLEDPAKALQEIVRVSKQYCVLSVPHEPWFRLANFLRGKNLSRWGNDIEHIQHWSSNSFELLVRSFKLEIIRKSHPFPWTIVLALKSI